MKRSKVSRQISKQVMWIVGHSFGQGYQKATMAEWE
jgi:hypothetical protein